jgi:hypothetical protein
VEGRLIPVVDGKPERSSKRRHTGESRYPVFSIALRALDFGFRRNDARGDGAPPR